MTENKPETDKMYKHGLMAVDAIEDYMGYNHEVWGKTFKAIRKAIEALAEENRRLRKAIDDEQLFELEGQNNICAKIEGLEEENRRLRLKLQQFEAWDYS